MNSFFLSITSKQIFLLVLVAVNDLIGFWRKQNSLFFTLSSTHCSRNYFPLKQRSSTMAEVESSVQSDPAETKSNGDEADIEDPELEAIKARVREMEEEAEKLKEMQTQVDKQMNLSSTSLTSPTRFPTYEEKLETDGRSVYVGNVDYAATAEELEMHFHGCGSISRVTILCDKFSGHPKGFAYIEFADKDSISTAMALDESLFRGRQIKVTAKRTNRPGLSSTDRPPRGGGAFRGRGRAARGAPGAFFAGYAGYATAGFVPRGRGRGAFRGRGRFNYYTPY